MNNMKVTLEINKKEKQFIAPSIKARAFRRALELNAKLDFENLTVDDLDTLTGFVCEVYGNQFTVDDLYDGLPAAEFLPTLTDTMTAIVSGVGGAEGNEGNDQGK
ncbi:phage tail assembly chaperone G [Halalkalibacter oceani]|uniref:phage tail assembly chaperone G n=1 Tax=Halalkalibacter oceani TaxID=1653776 RepID=UPI0033985923